MMEPPETCQLRIDMEDLVSVFDESSWDIQHYLDRETGEITFVTEDVRSARAQLDAEIEDADDQEPEAAFRAALERSDFADWMKEAALDAFRIDEGFNTRYLPLPEADSREGYRDMQDFVDTVEDPVLQRRLERAIDGKGAFRRFKDTLYDDDGPEQARWFAFRDARRRERALEWLADVGIEPIQG